MIHRWCDDGGVETCTSGQHRFVARHYDKCRDPPELDYQSAALKLVKCLDGFDQDVLSAWGLGILNRLDGCLVVSKYGVPARSGASRMYGQGAFPMQILVLSTRCVRGGSIGITHI